MVGRTDARAEESNVSTTSCAAGLDTEAGREDSGRWECQPSGIGSVQMAAVLVLDPIFEADLQPEQYAYRRDRSALDAVRHVHKLINTGHAKIVDADLSRYFDTLPHSELLKSVARRVVDGAMLHLIKMWLKAPVEETDERGKKHRSTRNRDEGRGTPQGSPISPLLSNLYMRRFVLGWKKLGHEQRLGASIVNYADDLVICCRGRARRSPGRDAGHDDEAEADGERNQDAGLEAAGREVRLSGLHVWPVLLAEDGTRLSGHGPSKKRVINASVRRSAAKPDAIEPSWTIRRW